MNERAPESRAIVARRFDTLFDQLVLDLAAFKREQPLSRVTIVVPGRPLLRWTRAALGRLLGRGALPDAFLGVEVLPLQALATRLTPDWDAAAPSGELHRLILASLDKAEWLERIGECEAMLYATFRDLYDAGFETHHLEIAAERLESDPWWERGQDLLDLYVRWRAIVDEHELGGYTARVRDATRRLELGSAPEIEHLFWYGIYDLTGTMGDFARVLCRSVDSRFYFPGFDESAPRRDVPDTPDAYLREVFESIVAPVVDEVEKLDDPPTSYELHALHASGDEGELTAVARDILRWATPHGDQVPWSRVAIIARDLSPYLGAAARIFRRYRIPFSTHRGLPARADGRTRGMLAICRIAADGLRLDRFIDAVRLGGPAAREGYEGQLMPLEAALRRFGVLAGDDFDTLIEHLEQGGSLQVPMRVPTDPGSGAASRPQALEPRIAEHLKRHVSRVKRVVDGWPETADVSDHLARLRRLVGAVTQVAEHPRLEALDASLAAVPLEVSREDFLAAVHRSLESGEISPESTSPVGVRLLDVMSARGMQFDQVFLIGCNRRRWPRGIREDPLMGDAVRRILRKDLGLYALPLKERGHAEEALLFRHAIDSADSRLTVCWQRSDDDGKATAPSPFVEPLVRRAASVTSVPRRRFDAIEALLATHDYGVITDRDVSYRVAIERRESAGPALGQLTSDTVTRQLLSAGLVSVEARDALTAEPGPHDGLVGATWTSDRFGGELAPTRLEELLRCPWQHFVRRRLQVVPVDPARDLPGPDPLRVGVVLHAVHERLVRWMSKVNDFSDADLWEDAALLARTWTVEQLERALETEPTLAPYLRVLLLPELRARVDNLLVLLRRRYALGGRARPDSVEESLSGSVEIDGHPIHLTARADRLDHETDGRAVADLKTGGALDDVEALVGQMRRGRRQQVAFYHWLSEGTVWAGYEFVPQEGEVSRVGLTAPEWATLEPAMTEVLATGARLLENGIFVFRHGRHCDYCDVAATCLRQHYPARRRLDAAGRSETSSSTATLIEAYRTVATRGVDDA